MSPYLDDYRTAADVVFTGELIWRDDSVRSESRLYFSVEGVHKGAAAANQVVVTPAEITACGVDFAPGAPIPPVVWWLSGAGVLLAGAGVIMVYRYRIRRR